MKRWALVRCTEVAPVHTYILYEYRFAYAEVTFGPWQHKKPHSKATMEI